MLEIVIFGRTDADGHQFGNGQTKSSKAEPTQNQSIYMLLPTKLVLNQSVSIVGIMMAVTVPDGIS